jgi:hypothetical protein
MSSGSQSITYFGSVYADRVQTTKAQADTGYVYTVPTAGATLTSTEGQSGYVLAPAGTLATLTVVLPPNPLDGQRFFLSSSQVVTALTLSGATFLSNSTLTALAAADAFRFIYIGAQGKWARC